MPSNRRQFLQDMGSLATGIAGLAILGPQAFAMEPTKKLFFKISLAQWSLHKSLFSKKIDTLDFPALARKTYNIDTVEYVNQFFQDKVSNQAYLNELLKRSKDNGVSNNMIMIDQEGDLGDPDKGKRLQAVENHGKWAEAAKHIGCNIIRVNAFGTGTRAEVKEAMIDGMGRLGEHCEKIGIQLVAENHGGYSSDAAWLAEVIRQLNKPHIGTLADFTNWCIKREGTNHWEGKCIEEYDPYKGVAALMPYAKGVSAKTFNFDKQGNAIETDYHKMMKIIKNAGFTGYIGIEYEGDSLPEKEGILKTKALLERVGSQFS